jgi:hypothetical protein
MSIKLTVDVKDSMGPWIRDVQAQLKNLPREAFQEFKKITPVDTGNARRSTSRKGNVIDANYNYATVLDKGRHMTNNGMRGSKQAPRGMSTPTKEFIQRRVKQITGR